MTYAVLNNENIVENIVVANSSILPNWVEILPTMNVDVGDTYDHSMFYSPEGEVRMTNDTRYVYDLLQALVEGLTGVTS